jgi:hypothetical protein
MNKAVTPFGIAKYLNLQTPQLFQGKPRREGDKGNYGCTLLLDPESDEVSEWLESMDRVGMEALDQFRQESGDAKLKPYDEGFLPIVEDADKEGVKSGMLAVKLSRAAGGLRKSDGKPWSWSIPIVDHNAEPLDLSDGELGRGTILRLSFDVNPWKIPSTNFVRISFKIRDVQVRKAEFFSGSSTGGDFDGMKVEPESWDS